MRTHTSIRRTLLFGLGLTAALIAVGAGVSTAQQAQHRSEPMILSVTPATPAPGTDPQMLRIGGQDFQPHLMLVVRTPEGDTIELKGDAILSQRESSFRVDVTLATAGQYTLVVTNADGGTSNPFVLIVRQAKKVPTPVIASILPEDLVKSAEPQELTVEGRNFGPGLRVIVTDPIGCEVLNPIVRDVTPTSFRLTVLLEMPGAYNMVVSNSTGAVSNVATITVR